MNEKTDSDKNVAEMAVTSEWTAAEQAAVYAGYERDLNVMARRLGMGYSADFLGAMETACYEVIAQAAGKELRLSKKLMRVVRLWHALGIFVEKARAGKALEREEVAILVEVVQEASWAVVEVGGGF